MTRKLSKPIAHNTDSDLPSYECDRYRELKSKLTLVKDIFEGRSAWFELEEGNNSYDVKDILKAEKYLPREVDERDDEYGKRLARSYFERFFRNAIETFSGFLSSFILSEDVHFTIREAINNIDLKGNSLEVFLRTADEKALRDEHCFILVEFPKRPEGITDYYSEQQLALRPYLCLIDTRDVLNWRTGSDGRTLTQVTIRETVAVPVGLFGEHCHDRYRVLFPGGFEVYEISEDNALVLVDSGSYSINQIPLIPYSVSTNDANPMCGEPPLFDLAELNIQHYQKSSDRDQILHKVNMPLLEINERHATPARPGDSQQIELSVGPNTALYNVAVRFVEPSGSAIRTSQDDIAALEEKIEKRSLHFLSGSNVERTATEVNTFTAPVSANLAGMARAKMSAVQQCFELWVNYLGQSGTGGSIIVDEKVLQSAMDAATSNLLLQLRSSKELTRKSFLALLKQGKILPKDFSVDEEITALREEEAIAVVGQKDQNNNQQGEEA